MGNYTRKTFISVSKILNQFSNEIDEQVFLDLVAEFGDFFKADNPNFDFDKFEMECVK
jgi:hypothetical protein